MPKTPLPSWSVKHSPCGFAISHINRLRFRDLFELVFDPKPPFLGFSFPCILAIIAFYELVNEKTSA
jgi:hypothetical protein